MDGQVERAEDRPPGPPHREAADLEDRRTAVAGRGVEGRLGHEGAGPVEGAGVISGVGVGVGFGFSVGFSVGGGSVGGGDGSTDGSTDGVATGLAGGQGSAAGSDPFGVGITNEGVTPPASGVGTTKHDGDGLGPPHDPPTSTPQLEPYGW